MTQSRVTLPQLAVEDELDRAFNACVHCGLCLPACPTYLETQNEADSPRGRIHLMKAVADERLAPSPIVLDHLEKCLICRSCETACPSSVRYHDIIEAMRPKIALAVNGRAVKSRALRFMLTHVLPFPRRAAVAMFPLKLMRKLGLGSVANAVAGALPGPFGDMTEALPAGPLFAPRPASFTPAAAPRRGSVLLLLGCVGSLVNDETNRATVEVLAHNGFDVHLLPGESCCGALPAHANDPDGARRFARQLVEQLAGRGEDYIVSSIAGCGAQLKALDHVLGETPHADGGSQSARAVTAKVRDVLELLVEVGLRPPTGRIDALVTYHDPCHMVHAQKITLGPRALLRQIPGVKLVELAESDVCCGAAGSYNLAQPAMARQLGARKAAHIAATGAAICATANIGCEIQIGRHVDGSAVRVAHVVSLLARSYRLGSSAAATDSTGSAAAK